MIRFDHILVSQFVGQFIDILIKSGEKNPVLMAFSAYTNVKTLFACKSNQSPNVMSCLDGMRAIAALWIVATHFNTFATILIGNPGPYSPLASFIFETFAYGQFNVDTFFVLSSTLAACKMLNELAKLITVFVYPISICSFKLKKLYCFRNDRLNIPLLYLQRILRLSPMMIVIALFNRFLLQFCANGPAYRALMDDKREHCEIAMWDSILFFDNFYRMKQVNLQFVSFVHFRLKCKRLN